MDSLLIFIHANLPLPPLQLLVLCAGVAVAYVIFGLAGFGTALVAGPVLAQFVPVATIVPLLALLDFVAAGVNVARDGKAADTSELKRIVPAMALGSLCGATILLLGRPEVLLLALGVFAVGYAIYSLSGYKSGARFTPRAALPLGLVGGVFSALFGSGGFIYAIYLAGRIEASERIRVTQSTLIGLSTLTRALLFLLAGVYANRQMLLLAASLLPAMLIGATVGRRITLALSRAQFLRIVSAIVLCSGTALIWRYFAR
ncbi:sulfite exporter TauE/SafE family protein [Paraburkholderia caledonica]|uniref:Probable membrane transporter protein n=1 Tax=Paraburkholderia caledonica TaxID=134536 RepID=A0AB73IM51_9BURK|nr:putative membrane protein YfcA [Paraburkholderia caledonica]